MSEQNNQKQEREKLTLNIEQKEDFTGTTYTDYRSSNTLASTINSIFRNLFKDYRGCYIEVGNISQQEAPISVVMDFTPGSNNNPDAEFEAFRKITEEDGKRGAGPIIESMKAHNQMIDTKESFVITQDAADLLYDLIMPDIRCKMKAEPRSFQSKGIYVEDVVATPTGGFGRVVNVIHEYVRCIDINVLMKALLPEKNEKGNKVVYEIKPVNYIPSFGNFGGSNYLLSITQYDLTAMANVLRECGIGVQDPTVRNRFITV